MDRLRDATKQSWLRPVHLVVLATFAGLGLILLVLLNLTIHSPEPTRFPLVRALEISTPILASTSGVDLAEPIETPVPMNLVIPDLATATDTSTTGHLDPATVDADVPTAMSTSTPINETPAATAPTTAPESPVLPTPVSTEVILSSDTSMPESHSPITWLRIPTIGVDAPIEMKSLDDNGVMQTPSSPNVVAWYDFSARPEDEGNVVFAGHLDYAGVGPAVFWRLDSLQPGNEIQVVDLDGRVFRYQVATVQSYAVNTDASQIVASAGTPTITLITCYGDFDSDKHEYDQRIVVTGNRVG